GLAGQQTSPSPNITLTLPVTGPSWPTARSRRPSPLTSPTATEEGLVPARKFRAAWKVPSPLPSSTLTLALFALATARSRRPSPLTSPTATDRGTRPAGVARATGTEPGQRRRSAVQGEL